jgi:hypothetical protein
MKKLILPAVAIALFMASCGGVKKDAEKICGFMKDMTEAQKAGDNAKLEQIGKDFEAYGKEIESKYPEGSAEAKELETEIKPCMEEAMKAAMGGN